MGWNYASLVDAIKKFCKRNDAFLVVKGRMKDPIRTELSDAADLVLYDENQYPSTVFELLSVARLCVHFYSAAVLEAASIIDFHFQIWCL